MHAGGTWGFEGLSSLSSSIFVCVFCKRNDYLSHTHFNRTLEENISIPLLSRNSYGISAGVRETITNIS